MEGQHSISQYRTRLDKTLASHDLTNEETLKVLVRNQILLPSRNDVQGYDDCLVEKRTKDVSDVLSMLRSASSGDDERSKSNETLGGWKVKQDNQDYRVMYREGPEGTPFHTLLVEGYVDGPVDDCLCISWEAGLYQKWWPQFIVPTFKVVSSECMQKVRIGEQISLVRMKLSWPLSAREALVHYFAFEFFQDDLIVVLLKSISDVESIDKSTNDTREGIPDVQKVVRIDLVGGFALQKVTAERSYFRTIVNMDIKLDFVPPSFINFVSRQLIGSGFKLYKKEVASVAKGDADFSKALKEPLYTRIREALYSNNLATEASEPNNLMVITTISSEEQHMRSIQFEGMKLKEVVVGGHANDTRTCEILNSKSKEILEPENLKIDITVQSEEHQMRSIQSEEMKMNEEVLIDGYASHSNTTDSEIIIEHRTVSEIEEVEEIEQVQKDSNELYEQKTEKTVNSCCINTKKKVSISPEVEQALGTLEKVISLFREYGVNPETWTPSSFFDRMDTHFNKGTEKAKKLLEYQMPSYGEECEEEPMMESKGRTSNDRRNNSDSHCSRHGGYTSYAIEAKDNKMALASSEEEIPSSCETRQSSFSFAINDAAVEKSSKGESVGPSESTFTKRKNRKPSFCCLKFPSRQLLI